MVKYIGSVTGKKKLMNDYIQWECDSQKRFVNG